MRPVNGWITVKKIEESKQTKSGIIIPGKVDSKIQRNLVIDISDDVFNACKKEQTELPYAVGDIVLTHSQLGIHMVPYDTDENIMFLKFDAVMGVERAN